MNGKGKYLMYLVDGKLLLPFFNHLFFPLVMSAPVAMIAKTKDTLIDHKN